MRPCIFFPHFTCILSRIKKKQKNYCNFSKKLCYVQNMQKMQDASIMVKHVCLVHVENQWKSRAVECKNKFYVTGPLIFLY